MFGSFSIIGGTPGLLPQSLCQWWTGPPGHRENPGDIWAARTAPILQEAHKFKESMYFKKYFSHQ